MESVSKGAVNISNFVKMACTLFRLRSETSLNTCTMFFPIPPARWISWPRVGNLDPHCQQLYEVILNSHRMGDGPIFLKTSAPHSLMTTYHKNLLSARSISLYSTFKVSSWIWKKLGKRDRGPAHNSYLFGLVGDSGAATSETIPDDFKWTVSRKK